MKKQLKILSILFVMIFGTFAFADKMIFSPVNATYVEGPIVQDTVWTLTDSPFVLAKNITIYPTATLTIEPGVEVRFGGQFSIIVEGKLSAIGTPNNNITFTSNKDQPKAGDWDTIKFNVTTAQSTLAYCVLKYGTNGITILNSTVNVQNSEIRDNLESGIYITGSNQATIQNNTIRANAYGVLLTGDLTSGVNITQNRVLSNTQSGINLEADNYSNIAILYNVLSANNKGFYVSSEAITQITNNSISYNTVGVFYEKGIHTARWNDIYGNVLGMDVSSSNASVAVNAEYNYWGDESGPYHESLNPSGKGNNVGGNGYNLDFIFFLTAPIGYINQRPMARLLTDKTLVPPNQIVTFVATNSSDDRQVDQYLYDFGDGTNSGWTTLSIFVHKYSLNGTYTAGVAVRDDFNVPSVNVASASITVQALTPIDVALTLDRSTVASEGQFSATVRATVGASPVANADIRLVSVSHGSLAISYGSTDSTGYFTTTFTAPEINEQTNVRIIATASKSDYADGSDFKYLLVLPLLSVQVSADSNSIKSEATSLVIVHVTHNANPISDVLVRISADGGKFSMETGYTDSNGDLTFHFTASFTTTQINVTITATVAKSGYFESVGQTKITINPRVLAVQVTASPDTIKSDATSNMTAHVTEDANPVEGVNVKVSSDLGGDFSVTTGSTDSNGDLKFTFKAPQTLKQLNITITATATKSGYLDATANTKVTVEPTILAVQVTASPTTIESEATSSMTVHVTEDKNPVGGANVTVSSDLGGSFSVAAGSTDSKGNFTFVFTAPKTSTQVDITITVSATKSGYVSGEQRTKIIVTPAPTVASGLPLTTILLIVIPIIIVAIVAVLIKTKRIIITREEP